MLECVSVVFLKIYLRHLNEGKLRSVHSTAFHGGPQYKYNNNIKKTYIIQAKNIKSTYTEIIKRYKLQII